LRKRSFARWNHRLNLQTSTPFVRASCGRPKRFRKLSLIPPKQTLKQNQGNADAVRATIAKKTIRAPFAGRLGIRMVNLGEYVDTGKPIVSLQSLTPMHADFSLPQQALAQLATGMRVRLFMDAYTNKQFEGTLTAISPTLTRRPAAFVCGRRLKIQKNC